MTTGNNHNKVNLDLVRLGVFCKNALDVHESQGKIAIQAVGGEHDILLSTVYEPKHLHNG
ncbi:hypothetical protein BCV72DRAFT_225821 [Rhizopus microsporus var. microsporus]|uniref:Uncharacterized protein n=2 Tax=Rhizopus microsporus TaxID=58291 RepID=A0A2G4SXW4_RHIZD|nr:uncharacterized protein RHIMIDRAFT_279878 [Rhizopus microsporus ATCC 52813]ORE07932.1 hypothetical protein BCV72DRAFT_225821 [Rhizopus microsporus var. microsporus]PHZ13611.1 hypothetical protein RHIMIDRAFT_279878 [Rhizopus microsporus ATCC 52813]